MTLHVLSFSIAVPEDGIAHAGGEYYLRHVRALVALGHRVTIVAPRTAENVAAAARRSVQADVLLIGPGQPWRRPADLVVERFRPARPAPSFRRGVSASQRIPSLVRSADVVEFQWTQTGLLQRETNRVAKRPSLLVSHDVMTQSLLRDAEQEGVRPVRRVLRWIKYWLTRVDERAVLRGKTMVVAFSEKDRALLAALAPGAGSSVLAPPLEPRTSGWREHRPPSGATVLFVGAFDRNENSEAALWLIDRVWPAVRRAAPEARLVLAGGGPTAEMRAATTRDPSISTTGYVEDLDEMYRQADLVVVPLRNGAGVKFKTVTAMMWGVPVVTTTVGAEGIADRSDGVFVAVEDEPAGFASAMVSVLEGPERWEDRRLAARALAVRAFGDERFRDDLRSLLRSVLDASAVDG